MPRFAMAVLAAALLAALLTSATPAPARADSGADTVIIELRIWQRVDNPEDVWVSARPKGGRWDTLGTIPLPRSGLTGGYAAISWYRYGDLAIAGVGLRVWQSVFEPWDTYVQACANACPERQVREPLRWSLVGMHAVPLHRGQTASGRYHYGDLEIAVPRGNPGLLADREYLLALRRVLQPYGSLLDWSGARATVEWEGVNLGGTPPRVTGLNLANRGLTGEIWGWLGNLTELRELDLSGNALTGSVPSKLHLLTKLTHVYLHGNDFQGCVPPGLRRAASHDLDSLELPDCPEPPDVATFEDFGRVAVDAITLTTGTYRLYLQTGRGSWSVFVFDVPPESSLRPDPRGWDVFDDEPATTPRSIFDANEVGTALRNGRDADTWLFLGGDRGEWTGRELETQPLFAVLHRSRLRRSRVDPAGGRVPLDESSHRR